MGHSLETKERAFQLYCQGLSFDDIARDLDRAKTHVNKKTLIRWKRTEGWEARKSAVVDRVREQSDARVADEMAEVVKETKRIRRQVAELLREVGKPKSLEGGVSAYVQLTRLLRELVPPKTVEGDAGELIDRILDVLLKHPKVGLVIEKYRGEILEELARTLRDKGTKGQRGKGS